MRTARGHTQKGIVVLMILLLLSMPLVHAAELRLTYDANGNLVTGDGKYRVYNSLNQLWKVYNGSSVSDPLLEELTFHPTEERIWYKKLYHTNGTLKETVYYLDQNFIRIINDSGTHDYTYIYHDGILIAQQNPDGTKIFIHGNHEGSTTVVTNSTGEVIENTTMSPFGEVLSGGTQSRYDYENKETDDLTGEIDYHARMYTPQTALFSQPDTMIQNAFDPQALNRFMFERGNPIKMIDPDGRNFRIYLDEDSHITIAGKTIVFGHIAIGVDDPDHPGQEIFYENVGLDADDFPNDNIRHVASLTGLFNAKTSATSRPVKFGNERVPPMGYEQYIEYEQGEEQDRAMIQKGNELVSKGGNYHATVHNSKHFAVMIIESGGYKVETSLLPITTFKNFQSGKGITTIKGRIEILNGKTFFIGVRSVSPKTTTTSKNENNKKP